MAVELPTRLAVPPLPPRQTRPRQPSSELGCMPLHERESRHRADRMANRARTPVPKAHAGHVLRNHVPLYGHRSGWKLAGRDLISPDGLRLPEGSITERSQSPPRNDCLRPHPGSGLASGVLLEPSNLYINHLLKITSSLRTVTVEMA